MKQLYNSPSQNSHRERLEIAHIFKQTNFGFGKEQPKNKISTQQGHFPEYQRGKLSFFDIKSEKDKMRKTNFDVGVLPSGFDTSYKGQFARHGNVKRTVIDQKHKDMLEQSHWDHSRSWSENFRTEQFRSFKSKRDPLNFNKDKVFGYQNTLNQIATHYNLGVNPNSFETTTQNKFRDNSQHRTGRFQTRKVKDYQETHHFQMGNEGVPMMTSTWTHFSKKHLGP